MNCRDPKPVAAASPARNSQPAEDGPVPDDDLPVRIIERQAGWHLVNVRELWRYRELLFFLTWRDVKVRYKQTVLGATWAVLQPLATMTVFCLFLGNLVGLSTRVEHYPLFVFAGLIPWTFFANAVTAAGNSVVGNQNLVTKVYFPRLIVPTAAVAAGLVDFVIACALLAAMMAGYQVGTGWRLVFLPPIILMLVIASLGIGTLLSALTVAYRDFRYVVGFGVQLWLFATPAIYLPPELLVGPNGRAFLPLNPAYGLIYNFRLALFGQPLDWPALIISSVVSVLLLLAGCLYFRRVERSFADII